MNKLDKINLSSQQRQELLDIVKKGSSNARVIRRAHTLLMASEGKTDQIISKTNPNISSNGGANEKAVLSRGFKNHIIKIVLVVVSHGN
ncbi:MAG: hypothetical protein F6K22_28955 [Okeania sp. SIO2F4]|uniref:hypothetical protein n=1 Tax=Okeania sp. SIO2F4 TaxID=2607790 RepID=UPI00142C2662|nr:hypothetical protein [Okeania sp. SIO2F4]NES06490.1 hypothetical protein [Okeania sp. SIO2F4]